MSALNTQSSMATIDEFLNQVGATEKAAEAYTEPGSQGGATSHPVKDVDDRTEAAQEGERSSENESDVKADQGKPGVDSTPEASKAASEGGAVQQAGSAADDHLQIGTNVQPTGEDPSVETSSAKGGKEDPGSSHPARTDNDSLDGHKYSSDKLAGMSDADMAKLATDLGNNLCAAIAADEDEPAQKQASETQTQAPAAEKAADARLAQQAGWDIAGLLSGDNFDKQAADNLVHGTLQEIIKRASLDGDNVIEFLNNYTAEKVAEGEGGEEAPPAEEPPTPQGGGVPTGGGEGGGEDAMMAAMGGGEPAAEPPMGGGAPEGGGDPLAQLSQILEELGITPEELLAAIQGADGGGAPPEAGGAPPMGEAPPMGGAPAPGGGGLEVEAHDKLAAVKAGATREEMQGYVEELISRSRKRQ